MKSIPIFVILLSLLNIVHAEKRNIEFGDLYSYPVVGNMQLSPDGKMIVYKLTEYDTSDGSSNSDLYLISTNGGEPERLTNNPAGSGNPQWSPDGKSVTFISNRDGSPQIWKIDINGGEASRLTAVSSGIHGYRWSPDGQKIIFNSRVYPHCLTDSCNAAEDIKRHARKSSGMLFDKIPFRHYNRWDDGKVNHLFVYNLNDSSVSLLTPGEYNTPPFALAGYPSYAISPDGREVCYVMNTDPDAALSTNNDLFLAPVDGGNHERITENKANDSKPHYSPNGKYIAYCAMSRPGFESDKNNLIVYNRKNGKRINLTEGFTLSVGSIIWSHDSKVIYFTAIDRSWNSLFQVSQKKKEIKKILTGSVRWDFQLCPDNRKIVYTQILPERPVELFSYDMKKKQEVRLTYSTEDLFSQINITPPEHFWFEGTLGDSIHGMLTLPPDFDESSRYPLVLLIHGGPQWTWLDEFNYYGWNKYLVAAQGYVVAQIDPHGSRGYGQEFADAVTLDWAGNDYKDLMMGVDYLIAENDFIDENRLAAMGRSYGGFMVNWIEGQTDRFDCLISVDGDFDQVSAYYTTEELWFPEWDFGGTPWENPELYHERSPLTYVNNFNTPCLIIHGQLDYRVDLSQALGMFTVLQRKGIDSQFLYFPDEGHSIHGIKNLEYSYEVQFKWLAKYLR